MENIPKAVIFDMDGVLVDSEAVAPELEKDLWSKLGVEYTGEFKKEIIGMRKKDVYSLAREKYNPNFSIEEAQKAYDEFAEILYKERVNLMPGAQKLLNLLQEKNIPMAIASSSPQEWIGMVVERFRLKDFFQHLLSVESMDLPGKPDPAVFSEAIRLFGVEPSEVVIFEDSIKGVVAAKASGARVVAVPDPTWSHGDFSEADLVADSLEDPQIITFLGL